MSMVYGEQLGPNRYCVDDTIPDYNLLCGLQHLQNKLTKYIVVLYITIVFIYLQMNTVGLSLY